VKVTLQDKDGSTLTTELGALQSQYNGEAIEFKNSKGEIRKLAYNRVDRLGRFIGDRETELEAWDVYVAVCFRAAHEQKKSVNEGASLAVKAGHSIKMGTASASTRTSKMNAKKSTTVVALAHAQKLAKAIHDIQQELAARAEAERAKAKEAADAELLKALMAPAPTPVVAAA
jgi:uncharacterized membrane protein YqiK